MSYRMTTNCNTKLDILQEEAPLAFPVELLRDVAEALELAVAHPNDYLCIIRLTHSPALLQAAAQLLPAATRAELRRLVVHANREAAA